MMVTMTHIMVTVTDMMVTVTDMITHMMVTVTQDKLTYRCSSRTWVTMVTSITFLTLTSHKDIR